MAAWPRSCRRVDALVTDGAGRNSESAFVEDLENLIATHGTHPSRLASPRPRAEDLGGEDNATALVITADPSQPRATRTV